MISAVIISVKVVPASSRNRVVGRYGDGIKVQVSASPERGRANSAAIHVLADFFQIPPDRIELVSSPVNPRKQFRLSGLSQQQIDHRLATL